MASGETKVKLTLTFAVPVFEILKKLSLTLKVALTVFAGISCDAYALFTDKEKATAKIAGTAKTINLNLAKLIIFVFSFLTKVLKKLKE